jgi:hypothetical protein
MYPMGFIDKCIEHSTGGCAGVAFGHVVEPVHGAAVTPGQQVPVNRKSERGGVVPGLFLNVLQGLSRLDEQGGERVSQGAGLSVA